MILIGVKDTTGGSGSAAADLIFGAFATTVLGWMSAHIGLNRVHYVRNVGGVLQEATSTASPVSGSASGACLTPNTAVLCHKATGLIGRHFRGRSYFPAVPAAAADSAGDTLQVTDLGHFQTAAENWQANLTAGSVDMYILHRDNTVVPTAVSGVIVEPKLATQRRRLRKVAHR